MPIGRAPSPILTHHMDYQALLLESWWLIKATKSEQHHTVSLSTVLLGQGTPQGTQALLKPLFPPPSNL